jgi:hypothetical protein
MILNTVGEDLPTVFESDCYGVRLAKIEDMLKAGKQQGLIDPDDLMIYVVTLLDTPACVEDTRWHAALQRAAAGEASLDAYFTA